MAGPSCTIWRQVKPRNVTLQNKCQGNINRLARDSRCFVSRKRVVGWKITTRLHRRFWTVSRKANEESIYTSLFISRITGSGNKINSRNMHLCSGCILSNVLYGVVSILGTIVLDMEMINTIKAIESWLRHFCIQQFRANLTFLSNKISKRLNTRSVQRSSFYSKHLFTE